MSYNYNDLVCAYRKLGVKKGSIVLIKTDLRYLGKYDSLDPRDVLKAHFGVLSELIDLKRGTIIVSTASTSFCNTEKIFDVNKTPSEMGVLTEFIRRQPEAIRSFHPFNSHAAIGKHAEYICNNVSRHSFGSETPKDRMLNLDTQYISIGLHPRYTCSVVHQAEMVMGVPYRYVKEFIHPVVRSGKVRKEPFYTHVWYRNIGIKRNVNKKNFKRFIESGFEIQEAEVGRGKIYLYSMVDFYNVLISSLKDDIYFFLDCPPAKKPFRD